MDVEEDEEDEDEDDSGVNFSLNIFSLSQNESLQSRLLPSCMFQELLQPFRNAAEFEVFGDILKTSFAKCKPPKQNRWVLLFPRFAIKKALCRHLAAGNEK